jgi:hypothetical protein
MFISAEKVYCTLQIVVHKVWPGISAPWHIGPQWHSGYMARHAMDAPKGIAFLISVYFLRLQDSGSTIGFCKHI